MEDHAKNVSKQAVIDIEKAVESSIDSIRRDADQAIADLKSRAEALSLAQKLNGSLDPGLPGLLFATEIAAGGNAGVGIRNGAADPTSRGAGCGSTSPVLWEGSRGDPRPLPDEAARGEGVRSAHESSQPE